MKQKLALCCALVHRPAILLLDEPTTGVDAVSRREFWDLLHRLKASGLTLVVSTPYMDEADRCDRVALIQRGRLLAIDTPFSITQGFGRALFGISAADRYRALLALREYPHARTAYPFGQTLHYTDARAAEPRLVERDVHDFLSAKGLAGVSVASVTPTVEDSFMELMGTP